MHLILEIWRYIFCGIIQQYGLKALILTAGYFGLQPRTPLLKATSLMDGRFRQGVNKYSQLWMHFFKEIYCRWEFELRKDAYSLSYWASEWEFNGLFQRADGEVHIVHTSRVINHENKGKCHTNPLRTDTICTAKQSKTELSHKLWDRVVLTVEWQPADWQSWQHICLFLVSSINGGQ